MPLSDSSLCSKRSCWLVAAEKTSKGKVNWWPGEFYWLAKAPRRLRDRCARLPGDEDCRVIGTGAGVIFLEYGRWGCSKAAWLTGMWRVLRWRVHSLKEIKVFSLPTESLTISSQSRCLTPISSVLLVVPLLSADRCWRKSQSLMGHGNKKHGPYREGTGEALVQGL